jgi:hypothetical protein
MTSRVGCHRADARGAATVEFVWLGLVLLVPLIYVLVAAFAVQRAAFATEGAARAAGRAFLLAPTDAEGLERARVAAAASFADEGVDQSPTVSFTCRPDSSDCHLPGSLVTVTIRSSVTPPLVPGFLGGGSLAVRLDAASTAPIGTFREVTDGR